MLFKLSTEWDAQGCWTFFFVFRISHPQRNGYQRKCLGRSNSCLSFSNAHWSYSMLTQHWVNFNSMLSQFFYTILNGLDYLIMSWLYFFSYQTLEIQTKFRPSVLIHLKFCDSFSMFPAPWGVHLQVGTKCVTQDENTAGNWT